MLGSPAIVASVEGFRFKNLNDDVADSRYLSRCAGRVETDQSIEYTNLTNPVLSVSKLQKR